MRQRRYLRFSLWLAALPALVACGGPTGPSGQTGPFAVKVEKTELRLVNRGDRTVYMFVAEREVLALINWAACADPERCPGLGRDASETIRFSSENRLAPGREAVVFWWYSKRTPTGYEPDSLRSFVVRL